MEHKGENNISFFFFLRGWWAAGGREKWKEESTLSQT